MTILQTVKITATAIAITTATLTVNATHASTPATDNSKLSPLTQGLEANRWADSVMHTLSLKQKVGQLFVPRLDVIDNPSGHAALRTMVTKGQIGGFLLGKGTINGYAALIRTAQAVTKVPLLVTLDGEWGLAMRMTDAPRFPHSMALGAITDPELLEEYGQEVARQCKAVGIHVNFAPVLDVNSNPKNPVIGYRSFGENPKRVATLSTAYARGLEKGGVMSVAKHFPGHGDTNTDSHKALPTIDHSAETMHNTDLLPFQAFINAGLSGIMTGHLKVPSLDATGTPASLSHTITSDLLRDKMRFNGLIFTDALAMKGAVARSNENNCVTAIKAGADVLLGSASPLNDINAVITAVRSGDIPEALIDKVCRRILIAKFNLGLANANTLPVKRPSDVVNSPLSKAVNKKLSAAAITLLRNNDSLIPVRELANANIAVISIGAAANNTFSSRCRSYADIDQIQLNAAPTASQNSRIDKASIKIVPIFSSSATAVQTFAAIASKPGIIPVFFLNPYKVSAFKNSLAKTSTLFIIGDDTPDLRDAAAQAIFGGIDISGKFPVNLPGIAKEGDGITISRSRLGYSTPTAVGFSQRLDFLVDSIADNAIAKGAMPGCQIVIARKGTIVINKCFGKIEKNGTAPVTDSTLYDIASMTKAIATASGIMAAYDHGLFKINEKASKYIPGLQTPDKSDITIKQLLFHESGMPSTLNMWKLMTDPDSYTGPLTRSRARRPYTRRIAPGVYAHASAKLRTDILSRTKSAAKNISVAKGLYISEDAKDTVMQHIYDIELRPSKSYRYSCLNFCLLMELEENVTGESHDQWVKRQIFAPLGAYHTCFNPLNSFSISQIAPTEKDEYLRLQTIRGYVHDEIAAFTGGVQGNAGLFSTANDIAKYAQMLLQEGKYGPLQIISPETVNLFTTSRSESGKRALAFDLATELRSLEDTGVNDGTYGHTGFTGTCFWIDPKEQIIFIFLTNRINPSRNTPQFSKTNPRGTLMKAIYASIQQ